MAALKMSIDPGALEDRLFWNGVRAEFPLLNRCIRDRTLVYLDSAATAQKPRAVIESQKAFYENTNANVRRGAYLLSQEATDLYEGVRERVARFLGARSAREIVFTRGTTESLNLVAEAWGRRNVQTGDTVLVTRMEHHANFVPWQRLARERGARFLIAELDAECRLDLAALERQVRESKPKVLAVTLMSNVTGVINPMREIARIARTYGARVAVDAAQAISHIPVKLEDLGEIDFLAFSGHKLFGPTGIGVLWVREEVAFHEMDPYQTGGDMIAQVGDEETTWNELPWRFEAGTPNVAGVVGLGAAIEFVEEIGLSRVEQYEAEITEQAIGALQSIGGVKIVGPVDTRARGSVLSFTLEGVHPHDLATYLDVEGIAIRAGHLCAQPLMRRLGVVAVNRASFALYNTPEEVALLAKALRGAQTYFSRGKRGVR
jgi:cysteine desulfurase/selenocysteine lyase